MPTHNMSYFQTDFPQAQSLYQPNNMMQHRLQMPSQDSIDFQLKSVEKFKQDRGLFNQFKGTQAGASTGNPYIAAAGLGLDLLGKGVEIYGASQEREAAEAEAKAAERRYQAELARRDLLDRQREEQQRKANEMSYGDYAMGYENQAQQLYGQYQ